MGIYVCAGICRLHVSVFWVYACTCVCEHVHECICIHVCMFICFKCMNAFVYPQLDLPIHKSIFHTITQSINQSINLQIIQFNYSIFQSFSLINQSANNSVLINQSSNLLIFQSVNLSIKYSIFQSVNHLIDHQYFGHSSIIQIIILSISHQSSYQLCNESSIFQSNSLLISHQSSIQSTFLSIFQSINIPTDQSSN